MTGGEESRKDKNNRGRVFQFLHTKRGSRLTVLLLLVLTILTGITAAYALKDWRGDHVTKIAVRQQEDVLNVKWNRIRSRAYRIDIYEGNRKILSQETGKNSYRLEGIKFLKEYKVVLYGKGESGSYVRGNSETIYTRTPQVIETEVKKAEGFAGDSLELAAAAKTPVQYSVANENVATVDENGRVSFVRTGRTNVTVAAPESENELSGKLVIPLVCYPEELSTPTLSVHKKTDTSITLRIRKDNFAESYKLMKAAPGSEESVTYREIRAAEFGKSDHLDIQMARDIGTYTLKAAATVGKKSIESKESKPVEVPSELDKAATYSSLNNVLEVHSEDVDRLFTASGSSSAGVAQSMCFTGDGYVVAFVNRGNSAGCLRKYDKDGKEMASNTDAGHLGHANGCTYDPKTDSVYVMKTYASGKYHDIRVFDGQTMASKDSISFGTAPSGIGYDAPMEQFYMTASSRIYVTDSDLHMIRTIHRKRAYRSQDVAGYNGIVLSCIWTGGSGSYIDMYRALNGDYLGSIYAPFGEIESACVDDGHLVMLFNGGAVYRTKKRVDFPG